MSDLFRKRKKPTKPTPPVDTAPPPPPAPAPTPEPTPVPVNTAPDPKPTPGDLKPPPVVDPAPAPVDSTPPPVTDPAPTPAPVVDTPPPAPVDTTPAPAPEPTPASTPAPVDSAPTPEPTPAPVDTAPAPAPAPAPAVPAELQQLFTTYANNAMVSSIDYQQYGIAVVYADATALLFKPLTYDGSIVYTGPETIDPTTDPDGDCPVTGPAASIETQQAFGLYYLHASVAGVVQLADGIHVQYADNTHIAFQPEATNGVVTFVGEALFAVAPQPQPAAA